MAAYMAGVKATRTILLNHISSTIQLLKMVRNLGRARSFAPNLGFAYLKE
jgi:hypothetical protein